MEEKVKWHTETLRNVTGARRFIRSVERIPEEINAEFYYSWILFDPSRTNVKNWAGIYWTPWIIFDIDDKDYDLDNARKNTEEFVMLLQEEYSIDTTAIRIVFSTSKGFHVYLDSRVIDLKPSALLHYELSAFAKELLPQSDMSLYAKRHVIGIANSLHRKTRLFYSPMSVAGFGSMTIENMLLRARKPRSFDRREINVPVSSKLLHLFLKAKEKPLPQGKWASTEDLLNNMYAPHPGIEGFKEGGRNHGIFGMAVHYRNKLLSKEETFILCSYANDRSLPPIEPREVERHVLQAYKRVLK